MISARRSTSRRVASPSIAAYPRRLASPMEVGRESMTTIWAGLVPLFCSVSTALRPLVPKPTTTT